MSGGLFEESVSLEGQALIAAARTSGRTSPPVNAGLDILARRISIYPSVLTCLQQPEALYRSARSLSTGDLRRVRSSSRYTAADPNDDDHAILPGGWQEKRMSHLTPLFSEK